MTMVDTLWLKVLFVRKQVTVGGTLWLKLLFVCKQVTIGGTVWSKLLIVVTGNQLMTFTCLLNVRLVCF